MDYTDHLGHCKGIESPSCETRTNRVDLFYSRIGFCCSCSAGVKELFVNDLRRKEKHNHSRCF